MNDFQSIYKKRIKEFENYLEKVLDIKVKYHQTVVEAMKYSLLSGGKRIRAMLIMGFFEAMGGDYKKAFSTAASIEMIHAYSLIHDDLPCMDNDDYRRGKPTSHKVYGEAMALLAGDGLLSIAFELFLKNPENFNAETVIKGLYELTASAGVNGMIGGQVIDIESENKLIEEDKLYHLHAMKTGALIKCACKLGVIMADGNEKSLKIAEEYGKNIGMAFQIQDDILDVEGNPKLLGKATGRDAEMGKTTFVTLYGMEKSKKMVEDYFKKAYELLNNLKGNKEFLEGLTDFLKNRSF